MNQVQTSVIVRLIPREINVGVKGGDLPTRVVAGILVAGITILAAPIVAVSPSIVKIAGLASAEIGSILLMLGLFLAQKTHYAGLLLLPTPLVQIWCVSEGYGWIAVGVGLWILIWIGQNILTRRCGLNKLLGINSCEATQHSVNSAA